MICYNWNYILYFFFCCLENQKELINNNASKTFWLPHGVHWLILNKKLKYVKRYNIEAIFVSWSIGSNTLRKWHCTTLYSKLSLVWQFFYITKIFHHTFVTSIYLLCSHRTDWGIKRARMRDCAPLKQ